MTTFQFILGMIFCLALLGVRAYLTIRRYGKNDGKHSASK